MPSKPRSRTKRARSGSGVFHGLVNTENETRCWFIVRAPRSPEVGEFAFPSWLSYYEILHLIWEGDEHADVRLSCQGVPSRPGAARLLDRGAAHQFLAHLRRRR